MAFSFQSGKQLKRESTIGIVVFDSITDVRIGTSPVVVCGSHGGLAAAHYAISAGVSAAIFNDAGVGKNRAGIAGLADLNTALIPAAAVDFRTARIGDGQDTLASGTISFANELAQAVGVRVGITAREAAAQLASRSASKPQSFDRAELHVARRAPAIVSRIGSARLVLLDSASQLSADHARDVVVTGSHGGRVNGQELRHPAFAAFFNDAGVGKGRAGISRLEGLDRLGIASATADYRSAEIGNSEDTYLYGSISYVNRHATALGVRAGTSVRRAADLLLGFAARTEG